MFALWFRSRLVLRFLPRAYWMGSRMERSGIMSPNKIPIHSDVLVSEKLVVLAANMKIKYLSNTLVTNATATPSVIPGRL